MTDLFEQLISRHHGPSPYPYTSLQIGAIFLIVFLTFLAIVFCGLRVYSRTLTKGVGLDDWLICVATVFTINQCWASNLFIHYGYVGVHGADIPLHEWGQTWLWNWLGQLFYTPILALVKISVLVFLKRLGGRQRKGVSWAIDGLIWFNAMQLIAVMGVTFFQCAPIKLAWQAAYFERENLGHCVNLAAYTMVSAALNILTDLLTLVLPFRIFLDLRINKKMRNALVGIFLLGLIIPILSVVRLYLFYRNFFVVENDPTYSIGYVTSAVESNFAIIVASLPPLWPLARRWFPVIDNKLGVNRHHRPDFEVEAVDDGGGNADIASPPKVRVTWTRSETPRHEGHTDSPMMTSLSVPNDSLSAKRHSHMLPPSPYAITSLSSFASPMSSPQKTGSEKDPADYFGNFSDVVPVGGGPDRDSYHGMITGSGQRSPWGNHGTLPDSAYKNNNVYSKGFDDDEVEKQGMQLGSDNTTFSLPDVPPPAFRLTMPPRSKTTPAGFKLGLPPQKD